jgi:hypothetical protein
VPPMNGPKPIRPCTMRNFQLLATTERSIA